MAKNTAIRSGPNRKGEYGPPKHPLPKKKSAPFTRVPKTTGKPDDSWTLSDLKGYVRRKKLNKPEIKLSMKKADLVKGLKKHGHWKA